MNRAFRMPLKICRSGKAQHPTTVQVICAFAPVSLSVRYLSPRNPSSFHFLDCNSWLLPSYFFKSPHLYTRYSASSFMVFPINRAAVSVTQDDRTFRWEHLHKFLTVKAPLVPSTDLPLKESCCCEKQKRARAASYSSLLGKVTAIQFSLNEISGRERVVCASSSTYAGWSGRVMVPENKKAPCKS